MAGRPCDAGNAIQLSEDESRTLAELSRRQHLPEAALLRKLVLDGLESCRLQQAVGDYERGAINLGEAAVRAGIAVEQMLAELDRRGIAIGSADQVAEGLENLAELFGGSPELRAALTERRPEEQQR